jgi:hypothetical protein
MNSAYIINKDERPQSKNLAFHPTGGKKEEQARLKAGRRKKIIEIRKEVNREWLKW